MTLTELTLSETSASLAQRELATQGYTIFRNVLPEADIEALRGHVAAHFRASGRAAYGGRYDLRGMNRAPWLARFMSGAEIVSVIKHCVAPQRPVLTGECDIMADTLSGWHKDITEDMALDPRIFTDAGFQVFKLGVYLQDQPDTSRAAFRVRPGTHRRAKGPSDAETPLNIRSGDVVVFDVRLDHAGQSANLAERGVHRLFKGAAMFVDPEAAFTRVRKAVQTASGRERQRLALFLTFGPDSEGLRVYEKAGRKRHGPISLPLDSAASKAFAAQGIEVIQGDFEVCAVAMPTVPEHPEGQPSPAP